MCFKPPSCATYLTNTILGSEKVYKGNEWLKRLARNFVLKSRKKLFCPNAIINPRSRKNTYLIRIHIWGQFHKHFTCSFFVQKFRLKLFLYLNFRFCTFFGTRIWVKCWWTWHSWSPNTTILSQGNNSTLEKNYSSNRWLGIGA